MISNQIITINEGIDEVLGDASKIIKDYTPILFYKDFNTNNQLQAWATGVLVKLKNKYFLFTAAHIIENILPETIGIMLDDVFQVLGGTVRHTELLDSRGGKIIDICIWEIEKDVAKNIESKMKFFSLDNFNKDLQTYSGTNYLVWGYPYKNVKVLPSNPNIKSTPLILLSKLVSDRNYENIGYDYDKNLVLEYKRHEIRKSASDKIEQGRKPKGCSGCGIWVIPNLCVEKGKTPPHILAGIMTKYLENEDVIVGTRIHIIVEIIRNEFDIPLLASKITNVQISRRDCPNG